MCQLIWTRTVNVTTTSLCGSSPARPKQRWRRQMTRKMFFKNIYATFHEIRRRRDIPESLQPRRSVSTCTSRPLDSHGNTSCSLHDQRLIIFNFLLLVHFSKDSSREQQQRRKTRERFNGASSETRSCERSDFSLNKERLTGSHQIVSAVHQLTDVVIWTVSAGSPSAASLRF